MHPTRAQVLSSRFLSRLGNGSAQGNGYRRWRATMITTIAMATVPMKIQIPLMPILLTSASEKTTASCLADLTRGSRGASRRH